MDIDVALDDFNQKFIIPLFADITRTLEVTCQKSGEGNHGSNFIGNTVVLMGIEATSQFIDLHSEKEINDFQKEAKQQYKKLNSEQKKYLIKKHSLANGSTLAMKFMKKYFDPEIFNKKEFDIPLVELIWAFRNSHAHAFYPHYKKNFNEKQISGAVDWFYKDFHKRIGITISEIENNFHTYKTHLYKAEENYFRICPQILFVFFKRAIEKYIVCIRKNTIQKDEFLKNYKKLSETYEFEIE